MIHYKNLKQAEAVLEALGSPVRREMLDYILSDPGITMTALADRMHLTGGAVTAHIKVLVGCGLISVEEGAGKRGVCKRCVVVLDKLLLDLANDYTPKGTHSFTVGIGDYSECDINPYCGIAAKDGFLGERDDPRYFSYPERASAAMLYFRSGKVVYTLPQPLRKGQKAKRLSVTFEISSKAAGYGRSSESSVKFFLCGKELGEHIVDGEFTDRRGLFNPEWYSDNLGQYGRIKTLSVDARGAYIDGVRIGGVTVGDLNMNSPSFGMETESGLALFGAGFGDYDSSIMYEVNYE